MTEASDAIRREHVRLLPGHEGARVRTCIFASYNKTYAALADVARPNWKAYADRHNYAVRFYPEGYHEDPSQPDTFGDKGKFRWYYDLKGHCEIVMFLDIDSLFMNMDIRIEDRLGLAPFLWTYDDNGPLSGLWIARTDDTTEGHLRKAYTRAAVESHVRHGQIEPNGISDQDAMRELMHVPPFHRTFFNCQDAKRVGHCYESNYNPGDWILTFPGMPVAEKLERMKRHVHYA